MSQPLNTPTTEPTVSVIMPTYLRSAWLIKALESLDRQTFARDRYEVIMVDSSPNDQNSQIFDRWAQGATCRAQLLRKTPEGPGPSRNLGARHAKGEFLAFIDSDCFAHENWLVEGIARFEDGVGIVQGKTLPDPAGRPNLFSWYLRVEEESFVYEAANIFYRRIAFESVDGFPADRQPTALSPLGGEDLDLAWRVKRKGWKTRFAREAIVYHEVQPVSIFQWIHNPRMVIWPALARRFPEIRTFFFARYFFDRFQAFLFLGLVGTAFAFLSAWCLVAWIPYLIARSAGPARTLGGLGRVLRPLVYLPHDACRFYSLLMGSIRARAVVL
jgi:glycosyltransferase involved in cell wall biosynthesis